MYKKLKNTYWKYIEVKIFEEHKYNIIDGIINDYTDLITDINVNDLDLSTIMNYRGNYNMESLINIVGEMIIINKTIDSEHYDEIYTYISEKLIKNDKYLPDVFKFIFERLEFIKNVKTTVIANN